MNQNPLKQKLFNSLLLLSILLQTHRSALSFFDGDSELFFLSKDGKQFKPLKLSNADFSLKKVKLVRNEQDDGFAQRFDVLMSLNPPGWIVKKKPGNSAPKVERGDSVEYFHSPEKTMLVTTFEVDTEQLDSGEYTDWDFAEFVNSDLYAGGDESPQIELYEYLLDTDANDLVKSTLNNQQLLAGIAGEKSVEELFALNDEVKDFDDFLEEKEERDQLIHSLVSEVLLTLTMRQDWHQIEDEDFKKKFLVQIEQIKGELTQLGVEFMDAFAGDPSNLVDAPDDDEAAYLIDWFMSHDEVNLLLMFQDALYKDTDRYVPPKNKWPTEMKAFAVLMKHRLISRLYRNHGRLVFSFKGEGLSIQDSKNIMDALTPLAQGKSQLVTAFVSDLVERVPKLLHVFTDQVWLSLFYFASNINGFDAILEQYAVSTLEDNTFAAVCVKDGLLARKNVGWSDDPSQAEAFDLMKKDGRRLLV